MFPFRDRPPRRDAAPAGRPGVLAALTLALAVALPAVSGATLIPSAAAAAENALVLRRALSQAAGGNWDGARRDARIAGPLSEDIIAWQRLRAGQGSLAEYADFVRRNADWPGMELLRKRAEAHLARAPAAEVIAWFDGAAPVTAAGLRQLATALAASGRQDEAAAIVADHWAAADIPLEAADERALLEGWGKALAGHHAARAGALLNAGDRRGAQRLLPMLTGDGARLTRLRIALQSGGQSGAARLAEQVAALPAALQDDPGLNLDRFRWRMREKDIGGAGTIMQARSTSAEALGDPAAWAALRIDLSRAALRDGDAGKAHALASAHFLPAGTAQTIELDWLAGYAAFKAGDMASAREHFEALRAESATAITQGRALYWLARVAQAEGDSAGADGLMRQAAAHQSSWYGQLAAEAAGIPMDPALAPAGRTRDGLPDWRGSAVMRDRRVQAAVWLFIAGDPALAQRFLLHTAETAGGEDIGRLARLMDELGQPHYALRLAKAAAMKGAVYPAALFPLTGLEGSDLGIPAELLMAIARRESEFNPVARSPSGARGLMQVMPATAEHIAVDVGLPYDLAELSANPVYNAMYGATYLAGLRARYGPSIALVAAGYNAGPGRSAQWLKAFGDLRAGADPIDWVEAIPFDETRNYVMRVAEALPIYRARITGQPVAFTPLEDLTGGGVTSVPLPQPDLTLAVSSRPVPNPRLAATRIVLDQAGPTAAADTGERDGHTAGEGATTSAAGSEGGAAEPPKTAAPADGSEARPDTAAPPEPATAAGTAAAQPQGGEATTLPRPQPAAGATTPPDTPPDTPAGSPTAGNAPTGSARPSVPPPAPAAQGAGD